MSKLADVVMSSIIEQYNSTPIFNITRNIKDMKK